MLREKGYHPILIRYIRKRSLRKKILAFLKTPHVFFFFMYYAIKRLLFCKDVEERENDIKKRSFDLFFKQNITASEKLYNSVEELNRSNELLCDALIVGSDQVWNFPFADSFDPVRFLGFLPTIQRKIAYSASFGYIDLPSGYASFAKPLLAKLSAVGVRESSAVSLCQTLDRNDAVHVLDPVLMLDPSAFDKLNLSKAEDKDYKKYIFGYIIEDSIDDIPWSQLHSYAKQNDLREYFVTCEKRISFEMELQNPDPGEFCRRIKLSSTMYTNSFHGLCFAILFHIPFVVFLRPGGTGNPKNIRVVDLLDTFSLTNRIYDHSKNLTELFNSPIDWQACDIKLNQMRNKSNAFLNESLAESL